MYSPLGKLPSFAALPSLVALTFALVACGDKAADVQDRIEGEFRAAPDSKACGAEGSFVSTFVPESWVGLCGSSRVNARFSASCVAHDSCYDTPEAKREGCDTSFRSNMEKECESVYAADPCSTSRRLCRDVAREYFEQVKAKGADAFLKAQAAAKAKVAATPAPTPAATPI